MESSANVHDFSGDCDDGISDDESLDVTLEDEIARGLNFTQNVEFLNLLCDNGKLSNSFAETLGHEEESGGSPSIPKADDDEEGIEYEFPEQVLETQADVDAEMVHETQSINDLRESGYTEDEIARCVAAEHTEDDEEEGIDETQPQVTIKKRRPSERIAKLGKKIDGLGSASENPLEIE
ncbi:unnamed protein product [Lactuca virosa]|uniref:Uncharacterized protein n=1 Tax=Lactuca virosa TaxID=75947 RepID=A0AAU9NW36_9ASTR|nr:unnamed protein product [Lactuca virosa]